MSRRWAWACLPCRCAAWLVARCNASELASVKLKTLYLIRQLLDNASQAFKELLAIEGADTVRLVRNFTLDTPHDKFGDKPAALVRREATRVAELLQLSAADEFARVTEIAICDQRVTESGPVNARSEYKRVPEYLSRYGIR